MSLGVHIHHGVEGEGNVEASLISLARSGFNGRGGGYAAQHDLSDPEAAQPFFDIGGREGTPALFGDDDVGGLLVKLGNEFQRLRRKVHGVTRTFGTAGRSGVDVDQDHRQLVPAEGGGEGVGGLEYDIGCIALGEGADKCMVSLTRSKVRTTLIWGQLYKCIRPVPERMSGAA